MGRLNVLDRGGSCNNNNNNSNHHHHNSLASPGPGKKDMVVEI